MSLKLGVIGREGWLSSGVETIVAGKMGAEVLLGIKDPRFKPVVVATPIGPLANIKTYLGTELTYTASGWKCKILRSVSSASEAQDVHWKVIALNPVKEVGGTVTPASEM